MLYAHIDSASGVFKISESKGGRSLLNSLTVVYECGGVAYGNVVWRINEVTLHRTRLVLGWVTVFGG